MGRSGRRLRLRPWIRRSGGMGRSGRRLRLRPWTRRSGWMGRSGRLGRTRRLGWTFWPWRSRVLWGAWFLRTRRVLRWLLRRLVQHGVFMLLRLVLLLVASRLLRRPSRTVWTAWSSVLMITDCPRTNPHLMPLLSVLVGYLWSGVFRIKRAPIC